MPSLLLGLPATEFSLEAYDFAIAEIAAAALLRIVWSTWFNPAMSTTEYILGLKVL
jgi:hypothetical protein